MVSKCNVLNEKMMFNLTKRNNDFEIEILSNGYVIKAGGVDNNDSWVTRKIYFNTVEELMTAVVMYTSLPEN